jgi:hypothetical protein
MPSPSDVAYARVRAICLRFPSAEEKLSHGAPSFHVRGKMFLMFVDNHHEDGRVAVWCKSELDEQRRLVASHPARFFVPPYVGVKGWVGVIVDPERADWIELSILVEHGWASVAPARLLAQGQMATEKALPPPAARVTTDPAIARAALERLTAICLALPETSRNRDGRHASYRVGKRVFAYFLDNHHGDGNIAACVKGDKREHARAIAADPARFFLPAYIGARGYLGIKLDAKKVDWRGVETRAADAYAIAAPKKLLQTSLAKNAKKTKGKPKGVGKRR